MVHVPFSNLLKRHTLNVWSCGSRGVISWRAKVREECHVEDFKF